MKLARFVFAAFIAASTASAQNLTADYQFNNDYTSSVSGAPDLTETGTGQSFASDTVRGVPRTVLQFVAEDGLALTPTTDVLSNNGVYTIALLFRFDSDSGYKRIIDFKNGTEDFGLYYLNGALIFYNYDAGPITVPANTYALITLTRDASGTLRGYVNGVLAFTVDDSVNQHGVIDSNNTLIFFQDDGGGSENPSGAVSRIRIWNGVLSANDISALSALTNFKINSLTPNNAQAVDSAGEITDDDGGIAVSKSKVFLTGNGGTGIFARSDLSDNGSTSALHAMVTNLHTQAVYTLADSSGNPIPSGGGIVAKLVMLDPDTGGLTANVINLSTPISISSSSEHVGIFSGWDRIVLVDGSDTSGEPVYNIDLASGNVTTIGSVVSDSTHYGSRSPAESWAEYGVAEFFNGTVSVVYFEGADFVTQIFRTNVMTGEEELVADFAPFDLSDAHEFVVAPTLNRWYFHFECCADNPFVSGGAEPLGFADATFTITPQSLYAADGANKNSSCRLYILNPDDGSVAQDIAPIQDSGSTTIPITALAFDPVTRILYGGSGATGSYPRGQMFTIDPATGAATLLGSEGSAAPLADITFTSDATLYGWGEGSDDLYTVNKTDGATTKVGESDFCSFGSGISANSHDVLYFGGDCDGPATGHLATVDRFTGQVILGPQFSGAPLDKSLNAFAFNVNDVLYASNGGDTRSTPTSHLVTINTTTGAMTDLGSTLDKLDALAFEPAFCDSNPPVFHGVQNITVRRRVRESNCYRVYFHPTATDPEDGPVAVTANPPSGSCFPKGTTTVTVTATDHCGNTSTRTFKVTVKTRKKRP